MKKIIRFTASWCAPCKGLAANLEAANLGIPIEVVDIDIYELVAMEFGIRSVPTLILVDENGNVSKRITGLKSKEQLLEWVE